MTKIDKPRGWAEWTEEERQNVVNVFSWLIKEDRKQNPHLYKKEKISPKSIGITEKTSTSIMSENS